MKQSSLIVPSSFADSISESPGLTLCYTSAVCLWGTVPSLLPPAQRGPVLFQVGHTSR